MKKLILSIILFTLTFCLYGQHSNDSILSNERTIDRPLSLHKGQMQINAGYGMSIIAANFSENGTKTNLAELGTAALEHLYDFKLSYGILNIVELSAAFDYKKKGVRKTNETILTLNDPQVEISYLDNYKGFGDLLIAAGVSYPFFNKKIEVALYPGISLPLFSNDPDEPSHEYIPLTEDSITTISFVNNYKYSSGAKQFHFGAAAKFRAENFAASVYYKSSYPLNISETIKWNYKISGNDFDYTKQDYEYLVSDQSYFKMKAEYQAISWFNVNLAFSSLKFKNGWSEEFNMRLANPETSLSKLTVGCEIKITGKLWFIQEVGFPVAGKNQIAPITFNSVFSYNIFPF